MHKIGADRAAVDVAGFFRDFAGQSLQFGILQRFQQAERIERRFQIAPAAESVEYALALFVSGRFREAARDGLLCRLRRFRGPLFF